MLGDLLTLKLYTREFIQQNPYDIFVFGDNMVRKGYGGQAAEARGEPNAFGIPTKWKPGYSNEDYFKDSDYNFVAPTLLGCFDSLRRYRLAGYNVWLPADGIGTGRADLRNRAPRIYELLNILIKGLH